MVFTRTRLVILLMILFNNQRYQWFEGEYCDELRTMTPLEKCVFCEIIAGRQPDTNVLFENENIMIIESIRPASDYHYVALPKQHITNASKLTVADKPLLDEMEKELRNLFDALQIDAADISFGFHWPPFTSVPHLHMHGIAPVSKMRWRSRLSFSPLNMWYCTPEHVIGKL